MTGRICWDLLKVPPLLYTLPEFKICFETEFKEQFADAKHQESPFEWLQVITLMQQVLFPGTHEF